MLVSDQATDKEMIEEMLRQPGRELDNKLEAFEHAKDICPSMVSTRKEAAASTVVPGKRASGANQDLHKLEIANTLFHYSVIPLETEKPKAAATPAQRVPGEFEGLALEGRIAFNITCLTLSVDNPTNVPTMMPPGVAATAPTKRLTLV